MLSLRTHAIITAVIFAAIAGLATLGNAVEASGAVSATPALRRGAMITFLALAVALMFSAVPVMVKLVLGFHVALGNAGRPVIGGLIAHERTIVFVLWALLALGLAVSLPAAIIDGAFD